MLLGQSVDSPLLLQYNDREWGISVHDDRKHFEVLVLAGAGRIELVARAEKAGRLSPPVCASECRKIAA